MLKTWSRRSSPTPGNAISPFGLTGATGVAAIDDATRRAIAQPTESVIAERLKRPVPGRASAMSVTPCARTRRMSAEVTPASLAICTKGDKLLGGGPLELPREDHLPDYPNLSTLMS